MKLTINLDRSDISYTEFKSKEDFDKDPYSPAGYARAREVFERGFTNHIKCPFRMSSEPERYPCLMIDCGTRPNPDGPDEIVALFIYDYELSAS